MSAHHFSVSRRSLLKLVGAIVLIVSAPACTTSPQPPTLSIAAHQWPGYEFLFLAQHQAKLNPTLVTLIETGSATASMQTLQKGEVDAAALTLDEVLRVRNSGVALSVVLIFDISAGADMVVSKPEIKNLSQIKGKRIGVEQNALGALMLSQFLKTAQLTETDIQIVPLTIEQQELAWKKNLIDIAICYTPVSERLLDADANKLFDSSAMPNMIVDVLAVREDAIHNKPDAIKHAISMHFEQLHHLQQSPQDASYRMAKHLNISAADVLKSFKGMELASPYQNHRLLDSKQTLLLNSAKLLQNIMLHEKILTQAEPLQNLFHAEFLPP